MTAAKTASSHTSEQTAQVRTSEDETSHPQPDPPANSASASQRTASPNEPQRPGGSGNRIERGNRRRCCQRTHSRRRHRHRRRPFPQEDQALAGFFPLDITSEQQCATVIQDIKAKYGRIDVLVHAAGVLGTTPDIMETTTEEFDSILRINASATFSMVRETAIR